MSYSPDRGLAAATVVTRNYFHFAVAWARSIYQTQPNTSAFICLIDPLPDNMAAEEFLPPNAIVVDLAELPIPDVKQFIFRYTPFELSCAIKPFIVWYALLAGHEKVVYIDTDTKIYGDLNQLFAEHGTSSICLTPHIHKPLPADSKMPNDHTFLTAGVYNGGFLGVVNDEAGRTFVEWWGEKCSFQSIVDIASGLHVDQKWLDLVPSLFDDVAIVRRDGLHVAYWNLHGCSIQRNAAGEACVNGRPIVLFHFSGVELDDAELLSKYQNRLSLVSMPVVRELLVEYINCVKAANTPGFSRLEYLYGKFTSGKKIEREWREAMRLRNSWLEKWQDPFNDVSDPQIALICQKIGPDYCSSRGDWRLDGTKESPSRRRIRKWRRRVMRLLRFAG